MRKLASKDGLNEDRGMRPKIVLLFSAAAFGLGLASCGDAPDALEVSEVKEEASGESVELPPAVESDISLDPSATSAPAVVDSGIVAKTVGADRKGIHWNEQLLQSEVKYHNKNYNGQGQFQISGGKVTAAMVANAGITDLACFAGMDLTQLDISDNPVKDLSPLAGQPLVALYMERTLIEDLTPLNGAPIEDLAISGTPVHSLLGLEGVPLVQFRMVGTRVADLEPLRGAPLQSLWCTDSPVTNISALDKSPLVSLTLHRTQVVDLSALAGTRLQRLHIGETPVVDLTPLAGLSLTRLVFTPPLIEKGIEGIRAMPNLREIGTKFDDEAKDLVASSQFWPAYDAAMNQLRGEGAAPSAGGAMIPFRPAE